MNNKSMNQEMPNHLQFGVKVVVLIKTAHEFIKHLLGILWMC